MAAGPERARGGGRRALTAARHLGRAVRLRCPRCGRGRVCDGWFGVRPHCAACRFRFDRGEPGYFIGAMLLNLIAAELVFAAGLVAVLVATWPDPPWDAMLYAGVPLMVLVPIAFFPFSRAIWIACDLAIRPSEPHDTAPGGPADGPAGPAPS
jgi:uncharacterized protein (DUF983 family)